MYLSDEPKTLQLNIRINKAEHEMIEQVRNNIRPRVSASKLLIYLCEERAREMGLITDNGRGVWSISE